MQSALSHRSLAPRKKFARKYPHALVEALEPRTLLSVTIVNAKTATYTDFDGDLVTVTVSKGTLTSNLFTMADSGVGEQLQELDLTSTTFAGANVTISVTQNGTGDGQTVVGFINATDNSLGKVVVDGALGHIEATAAKAGVASLSVTTLGGQAASDLAGGDLNNDLTTLGALTVTDDIDQAIVSVTGKIGNVHVGGSLIGGTESESGAIISEDGSIGTVFIGQDLSADTDPGASSARGAAAIAAFEGSIGNVTVNGSVLGGSAEDSAEIFADKNIGNVFIGHDVSGDTDPAASAAQDAASIAADNGSMGNVTVNGSLIGGSAVDSAEIWCDLKMGKVSIGGSLVGGAGKFSAEMEATSISSVTVTGSLTGGDGQGSGSFLPGSMGNVTIGGSVVGGNGLDSGAIFAEGNIGAISITGNLTGGNSTSSTATYTGYIESSGKITSVFIGGDVTAGMTTGGGSLESGSIRAATTIGSVQINGSVIGNDTLDAFISAGTKISTILIGQSVSQAQILAGYTTALDPSTGAGQIGKLTVSGDWTASSVLAGTEVGPDNLPGTADDTTIPGKGAGKGSIGSITIAGQVAGTVASGDHFGFVSSKIGAFTANGVKAPLTKSKDDLLVPGTDDVSILEV